MVTVNYLNEARLIQIEYHLYLLNIRFKDSQKNLFPDKC